MAGKDVCGFGSPLSQNALIEMRGLFCDMPENTSINHASAKKEAFTARTPPKYSKTGKAGLEKTGLHVQCTFQRDDFGAHFTI